MLVAQRNIRLRNVNENDINDAVRDYLSAIFCVSDQSRIGGSQTGKDAGNVDLCIWEDGIPLTMLEGIKLDCVNKKQMKEHINKLVFNYDPFGCKQLYILIYYGGQNFTSFWEKLSEAILEHLVQTFDSVIPVGNPMNQILDNSNIMLFNIVMDGRQVSLYFIGAKM